MRPWLRCDSLFPQRYRLAGVACSGLADAYLAWAVAASMIVVIRALSGRSEFLFW